MGKLNVVVRKEHYRADEELYGVVSYTPESAGEVVRYVRVVFLAQLRVTLVRDGGSGEDLNTAWFTHEENLHSAQIFLWGVSHQDDVHTEKMLPAGNHQWAFKFDLSTVEYPPQCFSYGERVSAQIKFTVVAHVNRAKTYQHKKVAEFTVFTPALTKRELTQVPDTTTLSKGFFMGGLGKCVMSVRPDSSVYPQDCEARLAVHIDNHTRKTIKNIKVELITTCEATGKHFDDEATRVVQLASCKMAHPVQLGRGEHDVTVPFRINCTGDSGELMMYSLRHANLKVSHELRVRLDVPLAKDPFVLVPVHIAPYIPAHVAQCAHPALSDDVINFSIRRRSARDFGTMSNAHMRPLAPQERTALLRKLSDVNMLNGAPAPTDLFQHPRLAPKPLGLHTQASKEKLSPRFRAIDE